MKILETLSIQDFGQMWKGKDKSRDYAEVKSLFPFHEKRPSAFTRFSTVVVPSG